MTSYDEEYQKIVADQLALLTNAGLKFIQDAEATLTLLEWDISEKTTIPIEQQERFENLKKHLKLHRELIRKTINEREKYLSNNGE